MLLTPSDPAFESRVRDSFVLQRAMATLGITLEDVGPGRVELRLAYRDDLVQQHGFMHAGVVSTAMDSSCGYAAYTLMPAGAGVVSVEFKVNMLAPARGEWFRVVGEVVRPGRTLTFCEARAWAVGEGREKLVSTMSATIMTLVDREVGGVPAAP